MLAIPRPRIRTANPVRRQIGRIRIAPRAASLCSSTLILCALFPFSIALAQIQTAATAFEQGRTAFERQDFEVALARFEAALGAGMQGPAIHYNIGVAAYRLGRYGEASAAFTEVARTPSMAALAHYNLGLIALAQADRDAARDHFNHAYTDSQDERLRSLARTQLDTLPAAEPALTWAAFAAAGIGYDDNVTLSSGGTAVGIAKEADVYGDLLFAGSVQLGERWRFDGDLAYLNYADLDGYDQLGVNAGARYRVGFELWRTDVGAQLGASFLDGDSFEQRQTFFIQSNRSLTESWSLRARYRVGLVDGADRYAGLDGVRHDASVRFTRSAIMWTWGAGYRLELSDFDSAALSATRHHAFADVRRPITNRWTVHGALGFRHSNYDDESYGSDNRVEGMAGAEFLLHERLTLVMQYLFTDSQADAPELDYQRSRVFAGVEATF
jgi:tetratricopeptide (TPR) repeat protein